MDAFGHKQLQGTATYLANFLAAECGCKTRAVELSTLQRSASHMASRVDIDEAMMVGGAAVTYFYQHRVYGSVNFSIFLKEGEKTDA